MKESALQHLIMLKVSELGHRVLRNNVGVLQDKRGHYLRYGLGTGSSDLIGWTNKGRFLAIEVKTDKGRVTEEQENFLDQVNLSGGIGFVARSVQDVVDKLSNLA